MGKHISLPPYPDITLDLRPQNFLPAVEKAIKELFRGYCPVCRVFVPEDEMHFANARTRQCSKIINISFD